MRSKFANLLTGYFTNEKTPLPEYPRPNFVRDSYLSLNGSWAFTSSKKKMVVSFDQEIIVPFSPESSLSGIKRKIKPGEYLFYKKEVTLPNNFKKDRLLLHFGAVDQEVDIYINDIWAGANKIAFFPFSLDITPFVASASFTILLRISDKTRNSNNFVGKQRQKRGGIWYTPQSGVWQSVWLESLPKNHLKNIQITPCLDQKKVDFLFTKAGNEVIEIIVYKAGEEIKRHLTSEDKTSISFAEVSPWSPTHPFLYDVVFKYASDIVTSYFAFRKVSRGKDNNGQPRFYLNNEPLFQSGVLDQGYFSDGLLTAPSEQAMIDDIMLLKKMGFNMLRKHIKIEPLRFYYLCDKLGMLVWQDMPNLTPPLLYNVNALFAMFLNIHQRDKTSRRFGVKNSHQKETYFQGLTKLVTTLAHFPSIVTWVPFNEGWGQFDALSISEKLHELDPTRLIDHASGWSDQGGGDYYSEHIYFRPLQKNEKRSKKRIFAITEFGGYSYKEKDHSFNLKQTFGYRVYKDKPALLTGFTALYNEQVIPLIKDGLSVIIYTQLSDVEDEVNGLITYDRQVVKFDIDKVNQVNEQIYAEFKRIINL